MCTDTYEIKHCNLVGHSSSTDPNTVEIKLNFDVMRVINSYPQFEVSNDVK